jgi:hypothetical protein
VEWAGIHVVVRITKQSVEIKCADAPFDGPILPFSFASSKQTPQFPKSLETFTASWWCKKCDLLTVAEAFLNRQKQNFSVLLK